MAGFRKAKAEQAALKIGMYGPPGSGKTFTSLLIAEGLAQASGNKRVAFVDTEHGSDFYCQTVKTRRVHPEAFDFDAIYTRSITEATTAIKLLSPDEYAVIVIDSITHFWEAALLAYSGKLTSVGTIPMHAWGKIKKPYKELINYLLSSPMHFIVCGRQGTVFETDEETDELKAVGVKMKAEGETPYEPHILIRMEAIRPRKTNEIADIVAYAEKDRTGVLAGRSFINPTFESLCKPLLGLLSGEQAKMATMDETASQDAEALQEQEHKREGEATEAYKKYVARLTLVIDILGLRAIGTELTPKVKAKLGPDNVANLRELYLKREAELERQKPIQSEAPKLEPESQNDPVNVLLAEIASISTRGGITEMDFQINKRIKAAGIKGDEAIQRISFAVNKRKKEILEAQPQES